MGQQDATDSAAHRIHQLSTYCREHPVTGPEGHSYTAWRARTPTAASPIPYNTDVADHIDASVAEIVHHTRTVNPAAGPLPGHVAAVYAWARQHTEHAPEHTRQRHDTIEYRHRLEHAIRAGDHSVIRPHPCPACHTLGLHWPQGSTDPRTGARCLNRHCATANHGVSRVWTLARLAYEHVAAERSLGACAT